MEEKETTFNPSFPFIHYSSFSEWNWCVLDIESIRCCSRLLAAIFGAVFAVLGVLFSFARIGIPKKHCFNNLWSLTMLLTPVSVYSSTTLHDRQN